MMKQNKIELQVDLIGGQTSLTKQEEKAIADYFKSLKPKGNRKIKIQASKSFQLHS